jgi:hypothetical protein
MPAASLKGEQSSRRSFEKGRLMRMLSLSSDAGTGQNHRLLYFLPRASSISGACAMLSKGILGCGYTDIGNIYLLGCGPSREVQILELSAVLTWESMPLS